MKVLKTPDRVWRAERWPDGWRLYQYGGLVVQNASLDRVVIFLIGKGVDPETLVEG